MSLRQKLIRKPWEHDPGAFDEVDGTPPLDAKTIRTALRLFLAIVTILFFLMSVAYKMRMGMPDWRALEEPMSLWFNTSLLVIASLAFEATRAAAKAGDHKRIRIGLIGTGLLTFGFLVGQYSAWQELQAAGLYASSNPSYSFFYMLTGIHGLHILGGLFVWARMTGRFMQGEDIEKTRESVGHCALYWHYLLAVWIWVFMLMLNT